MTEETRDIKIIDLLKMVSMGKIPKYVFYLGEEYTISYDSGGIEPLIYDNENNEDFFEYLTFQDLNEYVTISNQLEKNNRESE